MGGSTDDIVNRGGGSIVQEDCEDCFVPPAGSALIAGKYYVMP
jgi:hypothetical protein